jgi:hypothetical protein
MLAKPKPIPTDRQAQGAARQNITAGAKGYLAPPPALTIATPVARTLQGIVTQATLDQKTSGMELAVATLKARTTERAIERAPAGQVGGLQARLGEQRTAVEQARGRVSTNASLIAAGNAVLYSMQAEQDYAPALSAQTASDTAYAALTQALPKGGAITAPERGSELTAEQIVRLTPEQRTHYTTYIDAQNTANDNAARHTASGANAQYHRAQLQVYASDRTHYGSGATDALALINRALPVGVHVDAPAPIDPATAEANLDIALNGNHALDPAQRQPGVLLANATYDATHAIAAAGQTARHSDPASQANVELNTKLAYYQTLQAPQGVIEAQAVVNAAQGAYTQFVKDHPEVIPSGRVTSQIPGGTPPLYKRKACSMRWSRPMLGCCRPNRQ